MTPTRQTFRAAYRAQREGVRVFSACRDRTRAVTGCGFSMAMFSAIAADRVFRARYAKPLDAKAERARLAAERRSARLFRAMTTPTLEGPIGVGSYVLAKPADTRARVVDILEDGTLRCVTADLRDAGTRFVADPARVRLVD